MQLIHKDTTSRMDCCEARLSNPIYLVAGLDIITPQGNDGALTFEALAGNFLSDSHGLYQSYVNTQLS